MLEFDDLLITVLLFIHFVANVAFQFGWIGVEPKKINFDNITFRKFLVGINEYAAKTFTVMRELKFIKIT